MLHEAGIFLADDADFQGQLRHIGRENHDRSNTGMGRKVQSVGRL